MSIESKISAAAVQTPRPHVPALVGVIALEPDEVGQPTLDIEGRDANWQGPMCFVCEQYLPAAGPCPGEPT